MKKIIVALLSSFALVFSLSSVQADNAVFCESGKSQSPINIDAKTAVKARKAGLKFNYARLDPKFIHNLGKQLQIDVLEGANIEVEGMVFELKQLNFHIPSENTYNNQHFPMEIQFLHRSKDNQWAIVSLMVKMGQSSRSLMQLQAQLPMAAGEVKPLAANSLRNFERKQKVANYYRYNGSLTTPPCTEGVRWFIMNKPLKISQPHYLHFQQALKQKNNRPVQKLNGRVILK